MKTILGAQRPARRNVLWIAVAAIVLVLALARAAFSDPYLQQQFFSLGTDNVLETQPPTDGMMPPNGMRQAPPNPSNASSANADAQQRAMSPNAPRNACPPMSRDLTITQNGRRTYTYVASKQGCAYLIKRNGAAWVTVSYNSATKAYELDDPNGTGALVVQFGGTASGPHPHPVKIKKHLSTR